MKKLFFLTITALLLLTFVGCEETASEDIDPPSTLVLTATTNGLGVNLAWTGSTTADLDGYLVYFNNSPLTADVITTTSYQHSAPGGVGNYEVVAVLNDVESDPATATTALVEGTSSAIYYMSDPSPTHPSGFGWNKMDGTGTEYSLAAENHPYIDFVLNSDMEVITPDIEISGGNETWFDFIPEGYGSIAQAAACTGLVTDPNYGTYIDSNVGEAAVVALPSGANFYYTKAEVTSVNSTDHSITVHWEFQLIPNLRLLD